MRRHARNTIATPNREEKQRNLLRNIHGVKFVSQLTEMTEMNEMVGMICRKTWYVVAENVDSGNWYHFHSL